MFEHLDHREFSIELLLLHSISRFGFSAAQLKLLFCLQDIVRGNVPHVMTTLCGTRYPRFGHNHVDGRLSGFEIHVNIGLELVERSARSMPRRGPPSGQRTAPSTL